jgi:small subunit ribosomal protein S17
MAEPADIHDPSRSSIRPMERPLDRPSDRPSDRPKRKTVEGRVVSDKMEKTAVVQIVRLVRHPKYGKYMRRYTRFYVHDPANEARVGDVVEIAETRPQSRLKRWRLVRVVVRTDAGEGFAATEPSAEVASSVGEAPKGTSAVGGAPKGAAGGGAPKGAAGGGAPKGAAVGKTAKAASAAGKKTRKSAGSESP